MKGLIDSFNYAVTGIITSMKTERNMVIHYLAAIGVMSLSLLFDFTKVEFLILLIATTLVVVTELINTAIEKAIDLITEDYHPIAKIVKDISAGAVLISAITAAIVGYTLFYNKLNSVTYKILYNIKSSDFHLTAVAIILVTLLTIGLKAKMYKGWGTHFQGGAVSGHSALGFCIATIISFLVGNVLVITLAFGLAVLVAESRVEGKIHTPIEVVLGGVLGILVGILVFQIIG